MFLQLCNDKFFGIFLPFCLLLSVWTSISYVFILTNFAEFIGLEIVTAKIVKLMS